MPAVLRYTAALLLLALLAAPAPSWATRMAPVTLPDGSRYQAEILDSYASRSLGVMHRKSLPKNRLLWFKYFTDGQRQVWMKDCLFPIDVVWVDGKGVVVQVMYALPPCKAEPCPIYNSGVQSRHFLEGTSGWLAAHRITLGSRIRLGE